MSVGASCVAERTEPMLGVELRVRVVVAELAAVLAEAMAAGGSSLSPPLSLSLVFSVSVSLADTATVFPFPCRCQCLGLCLLCPVAVFVSAPLLSLPLPRSRSLSLSLALSLSHLSPSPSPSLSLLRSLARAMGFALPENGAGTATQRDAARRRIKHMQRTGGLVAVAPASYAECRPLGLG